MLDSQFKDPSLGWGCCGVGVTISRYSEGRKQKAFQLKFKARGLPNSVLPQKPCLGVRVGEQWLVIMSLSSSITTTAGNVFPIWWVFVCIDSLEETPKERGVNGRVP